MTNKEKILEEFVYQICPKCGGEGVISNPELITFFHLKLF